MLLRKCEELENVRSNQSTSSVITLYRKFLSGKHGIVGKVYELGTEMIITKNELKRVLLGYIHISLTKT